MDEAEHIKRGSGKWSKAGVPHKGWNCVDIEDLGEPSIRCEMCEARDVRYVHYMEHDDYDSVLQVGCVCAGHMEEDLVGAKSRESYMKSRTGKRKRWLTRKWKESVKGNDWLRVDGFRTTIYRAGQNWRFTTVNERSDKEYHSRLHYKTQGKAKLAAFDLISRLLSQE